MRDGFLLDPCEKWRLKSRTGLQRPPALVGESPEFRRMLHLVGVELRQSGLAQLVVLGDTLHSWSEEIARMWRFTRSNGITEGFHNKMETLSRQAYGFRNFENYRLRVKVLCS